MKAKLEKAINSVNSRYHNEKNDDDQVARMLEIDKQTKGYSFYPGYDTYYLVTDREKLQRLVDKYGYWSNAVKEFNETLKEKGGYEYMKKINDALKP